MKKTQVKLLNLHDAVHEHPMTWEGTEIRVITSSWSSELNDLCCIRLEQLRVKKNVRGVRDEAFGHAIRSCGHGHGKTEELILGAWLSDDDIVRLRNCRMTVVESELHFLASFDFEFFGVVGQRVC